MVFSKELLFIHVPKTGGMSVSDYLLSILGPPIYQVRPPHGEVARGSGVVEILGNRHLGLSEAARVVSEHGFEIRRFPLILVVIRNPYSLEVSRYAYLQTGHPWDAGRNQELALTSNFETFAIHSDVHEGSAPLESYFQLDGAIPPNMRIIRFENLAAGIRNVLKDIGMKSDLDLPHHNQSLHGDFRSYYTVAAEESVYRRYKWVFDNSFYERLDLQECAQSKTFHVHRLPISGPVHQVGTSCGFSSDKWAAGKVLFKVKAEQPVIGVSIQGWMPNRFKDPVVVKACINGELSSISVRGGEAFKWEFDCSISAGSTVEMELNSSETWCPKATGTSDDARQLSFQLASVAFRRDDD
jgi:hypothetical protein